MSLIDSYCESASRCFPQGEGPSPPVLCPLSASLVGAGSHHSLQRTTSDSLSSLARSPASGQRGQPRSPQHKNSVTKAWLQFQADIEAALFRKPSNNGMYKNLSDMLHSRMDQLEQVLQMLIISHLNCLLELSLVPSHFQGSLCLWTKNIADRESQKILSWVS